MTIKRSPYKRGDSITTNEMREIHSGRYAKHVPRGPFKVTDVIKTEHLNLIALSVDAHRAMLDEEYNRADDIMNINGLADIPLPAGAIEHRLNELIENPKLES